MSIPDPAYWTIAWRNPHANHFQRVTNWCGTWQEASDMCGRYVTDHPNLEVWYITTRAAELTDYVCREDVLNVLLENGKRIPIIDNAILPDEYLPTSSAITRDSAGHALSCPRDHDDSDECPVITENRLVTDEEEKEWDNRHPDAYDYGEPWGPDNPAPGSAWDNR